MICVRCGGALKSSRGTHRYTEAGLSNVILVDVEVRICDRCGEREVLTPHVEILHDAIARSLSRQGGPLAPEAVRFLRKWLNLTTHQFGRMIGVRRESVCRWERVGTSARLTPPAERLLRLLVALHESGDRYALDVLNRPRAAKAEAIVLVSPDWRELRSTHCAPE